MQREFRYEVADKYDELLSHATNIEKLDRNLQDTFSSVKALKVCSRFLPRSTVASRIHHPKFCYQSIEGLDCQLNKVAFSIGSR